MAKKPVTKTGRDEATRGGAGARVAQIAKIDKEIVSLLNKRAKLTAARQEARGETPGVLTDLEVLHAAAAANDGSISNGAVEAVFRELLSGIRAASQPVRVAYLGP